MDLIQLAVFIPLIFGIFFIYHLVFKVQLPSKGMGAIVSYVLGTIIIFAIVAWLTSRLLGPWFNEMVGAGQNEDWQQAINTSEGVVRDAFGADEGTTTLQQPVDATTPRQVIVTPTPRSNTVLGGEDGGGTPNGTLTSNEYIVKDGDTLYSIARQFDGVEANDILNANKNGIADENHIEPGQKLIIPAPSQ